MLFLDAEKKKKEEKKTCTSTRDARATKTMDNLLRLLVGMAAALVSGAQAAQKPISSDFVCQHPPYTVSIVSKSPMVLYLHDFVTAEERIHLQDVTYATFLQLEHRISAALP